MPKSRKRKLPVTVAAVEAHAGPSNSARSSSSRTIIRQFHTLIKRQSQLESKAPIGDEVRKELREVNRQIDEMGGLEAYQRMSTIGQGTDRGGGSEKVFIAWLKELGFTKRKVTEQKGRAAKSELLEVGALKPDNYTSCSSWMNVTPIDLNSRHPSILQQDFLQLPVDLNTEKWDLISLSLVLNFVPDLHDRGRMLQLTHTFLRPSGLVFLVLPLPCVLNSRYLTPEHITALAHAIGFDKLRERWREGGKVAYWLFQKRSSSQPEPPDDTNSSGRKSLSAFRKKTVLREGANRNNFCVLLRT